MSAAEIANRTSEPTWFQWPTEVYDPFLTFVAVSSCIQIAGGGWLVWHFYVNAV